MQTAKTLIRLGGCPGWSESSLGAHSFCWFCHVAAEIIKLISKVESNRPEWFNWSVLILIFSLNGESLILSCSGSYGDDEAVLKWKKHQNEVITVILRNFQAEVCLNSVMSSLIWVCTVLFCLHFWMHYSSVNPHCSNFRIITAILKCFAFRVYHKWAELRQGKVLWYFSRSFDPYFWWPYTFEILSELWIEK